MNKRLLLHSAFAIAAALIIITWATKPSYTLMMSDPRGLGDDIELENGLTAGECTALRRTAWHYCEK